jgi:hypothetical protein
MKLHLVVALIFLVISGGYAADPNTSGGMSEILNLTMFFNVRSSQFLIVLRNTSTNSVDVQVQPTNFQGCIVVELRGKEPRKYYEKDFLPIMLTSEWIDPRQKMAPGAVIVWKLPVTDLRDIQENGLGLQELDGASVWAEVERLAVVPPNGNYIENNARQKSTRISIEAEPSGSVDGSQSLRSPTNRAPEADGSRR